MIDAPAPRRHFASLDGYRAVAALLVVLCHAALISGLNGRMSGSLGPYLARTDIGVAIFFLLSGFLIYRPFVRARLDDRPVMATSQFYRRRVLRIVPAYWLTLTVVAFVLHAPGFHKPHSIVMHYLLLHVYDVTQVVNGPVQQSWSLATEVAFYLWMPLYVAILGIRRRTRDSRRHYHLELLGVSTLVFGSVAMKVAALAMGISAERMGQLGTWLPFRLDSFGLGMALAVVSARLDHSGVTLPKWFDHPAFPPVCWLLAAVTFWATCTRFGLPLGPAFSAKQAFVVQELYPLTAFFLLLPGVFGPERSGIIRRALQTRVMVWLGLISYGIYIWHEAWLFKWFQWTGDRQLAAPFWQVLGVNLLLTIPVAAASYLLVERPLLRLKVRRRQDPPGRGGVERPLMPGPPAARQ